MYPAGPIPRNGVSILEAVQSLNTIQQVGLAIAFVALIFLFIKLFKAPFRLLIKLLLNTIGGFVTLIIVNWLGSFIGISIGINWVNALIVGIFGLPGLGFLLILKWLLVI